MVFETVYAGSWVWIHGNRGGETVRKYARALRRTRTQFVIDDEFRSRFRRVNGEEIGGMHDYIRAIATVEEIAAFNLEMAARDAHELERREEERSLRVLFNGYAADLNRHGSYYDLRFVRLGPAQVRAICAAFKGAR